MPDNNSHAKMWLIGLIAALISVLTIFFLWWKKSGDA